MSLTETQQRALNTAQWTLGRDTRDQDAPPQTRIDRLRDALEMVTAAFSDKGGQQ